LLRGGSARACPPDAPCAEFSPIRDTDRLWKEFWEPVGLGGFIPKGIAVLVLVVCYLMLLPVAGLLFLAGVVHGLRGRRTRLSGWILREMSQEQVRKRHERMVKSLDTQGRLSQTDKALQSYLPPRPPASSAFILDGDGQVRFARNLPANPDALLRAVAPFRDGLLAACECMHCWY
jgi:hypothetical protein